MEKDNRITGLRNAISNLLIRFKTIIDTEKKVYMIQQTVLGVFKSGDFKPLPRLDYVLLAKTSFRPACEACAIDEEDNMFYQVSLVYNKNRRIIMHETKSEEDAFSMAQLLRGRLSLALKDVSVRGRANWIR